MKYCVEAVKVKNSPLNHVQSFCVLFKALPLHFQDGDRMAAVLEV